MRIECWIQHKELRTRARLSEEAQREVLRRLKRNSILSPLYWNVGLRGSVWANLGRYSADSAKTLAVELVKTLWELTVGEMQVRLWD